MLWEFTSRILVALPLVCVLAVIAIFLLRRSKDAPGKMASGQGWAPGLLGSLASRLPFTTQPTATPVAAAPVLQVLGIRTVAPAARLALVQFDGRALLIGVSGQSFTLLASSGSAVETAAKP